MIRFLIDVSAFKHPRNLKPVIASQDVLKALVTLKSENLFLIG